MPRHLFTVTLKITGPILTRDSNPAGYGVDAPFFARDGKLRLPGPLVEGKLREAFAELATANAITAARIVELMGAQTATGDFAPARGLLHFGDFECDKAPDAGRLRYRVSIDADSRAAKEQMLQILESPFASGETATFTGTAIAHVSDDEAEKIRGHLTLGFRWVRQLGAARTVGFGTLQSATVTAAPAEKPGSNVADCTALLLRITPEAPFCFSEHRPRDNVMTSSEEIPGAAILGCLAARLTADDKAWFDKVTVTHAFPAASGATQRPMRTPLTVAASSKTPDGKSRWLDFAAQSQACLLDDRAPAFRMDWKADDYAVDAETFGWKKPDRELRVRTAIDPETRAAKDGKLFSQELIRPGGCKWFARADFSACANPIEAMRKFRLLLGGELTQLGKTKAHATVVAKPWDDAHRHIASQTAARDDKWIVVLQTPAVLCDPRLVGGPGKAAALAGAYAAAWYDISDGALKLEHFHARQHLAGGEYLWQRFQGGNSYNPWLLTDAGSVFVLSGGADAEKLIADWLARGLPIPKWAEQLYAGEKADGAHWSRNPYIPQNGYGEIAVNPAHLADPAWAHGGRVGPLGDPLPQPQPLASPDSARAVVAPRAGEKDIVGKPLPFPERWIITGTFTTRSQLHVGTGIHGWLEQPEGATAGTRHDKKPADSKNLIVEYHRVARALGGKLLIPGSGWKGPVRAEFERLFGSEDMTAFFGREDHGGRVEFHDATFASLPPDAGKNAPHWRADKPDELTAIEASVALDRRTRTASEGKLFHTEFVPSGAVFHARLTAQGIGVDDVKRLLGALARFTGEAGAPTLGAEGANGWGRVKWDQTSVKRFGAEHFTKWLDGTGHGYAACEDCAEEVTIAPDGTSAAASVLAIPITLKFHSPLLVRRSEPPKQSGNDAIPNARPRLTPEGYALLPARSFRGALRSQCERILRTVFGDECAVGKTAPDPAHEPEALHDSAHPETLSLAARIFGAAGWRAVLDCTDFISAEEPALNAQREPIEQEFVAIDRFTGGAAGERKFKWAAAWPKDAAATMDFRPVTLRFDMDRLKAAKADTWAPGLLALALRDLAEGDISFGAGAGKGYGACTAEIEWLKTDEAAAHVAALRAFVQKRRAAGVDAAAAPA